MNQRHWRITTLLAMLVLALSGGLALAEDSEAGFVSLFDGKTLKGWKANEHPENWKVEDGKIVATGPRSHLFYVGDDEKNPPEFESFHFKSEVMTTPGSNSGIYFHVKWQDEGFPNTGFEAQVNNSHRDPVRTASIYHLVKNFNAPAKDNEWFTEEIIVDAKAKTIKTIVNGKVIAEYTEPAGKTGKMEVIDKGTFAFQAHDPKSTCYYKNIRVKRLP